MEVNYQLQQECKNMLKLIYKTFKRHFHNFLIEDLLENIPNKTGRPAIEIISAKREPVIKWLYYEANAVSRRVPTDFGNLERRNGILIMIQALIVALSNSGFPDEPKIDIKETVKKEPNWKKGVEQFTKKAVDN